MIVKGNNLSYKQLKDKIKKKKKKCNTVISCKHKESLKNLHDKHMIAWDNFISITNIYKKKKKKKNLLQ